MNRKNCSTFAKGNNSIIYSSSMRDLVFRGNDGMPATDSMMIAKTFGKRHADVIRSIENLLQEMVEISENEHQRNFALMQQIVETDNGGWKESPYYVMNRDGFSLLVMGFTGKKALRFKLDFIDAFNQMEQTLIHGMANNLLLKDFIRATVAECIKNNDYAPPPAIETKDMVIRDDIQAKNFFKSYHLCTGGFLDEQTIEISYANACILNSIREKMTSAFGKNKQLKKINKYVFWNRMLLFIERVDIYKWPHSLPSNPRTLCAKFNRYIDSGYESLIHGGMNNQNARKQKT
jgi:Rha family phage regulatory protein